MKAKLSLITSQRVSENGYPVVLELTHLKFRKRKTITHAFIEHWDASKNLPLKTHPFYNTIVPDLLTVQSKMALVNLGGLQLNEAVALLFGVVVPDDVSFYNEALKLCDGTRNGKLYKTVLNSFNTVFPGVFCGDITSEMAKRYMRVLLQTNKANGVHTYMRTLNALFNRVSSKPNPFKGVRPRKEKTVNKGLMVGDVIKIRDTQIIPNKFDGQNTVESINYDRYYWLLMFYLGGIDMVDLAMLRYDHHVINGRIEFYRNKGGTNAFVSNKIFDCAREILAHFDCKPYLVPIYKYADYNSFLGRFNKRFAKNTKPWELTRKPLTKSARYTFINIAKDLLIDERITMEIVGHSQRHTHSIYTGNFTHAVRDEAHGRIIGLTI